MVEYAGPRPIARRRRRTVADAAPVVRRLDWILVAGVAASVAYGLWLIAGITHDDWDGDPHHFLVRQIAAAALGTIGYLVLLFVEPTVYQRHRRVLYGGTLAVMALVYLYGTAQSRGSKRWIDLGFFQFQPSEFGKLLFVLFLAALLAERGRRLSDVRTVLSVLGLALLPIALVFLQPDFGTALVYTGALAAVLFVAGARWLHLTILGAVAVVVALAVLWLLPSAGMPVLKQYQYDRLTSFLHPDRNPQGLNYNIRQSITAVGSGGATGRGVEGATQTKYDYLPEHATDFAFASVAEERGFLGASFLLLLYLLIVWRGLKAVTLARDAFSAIAAGGIVFAFLLQVFVNVGGTIGIAPITGIPLPFVSVGGSAMVTNLLAMGVLQAIYARGRKR
jgi:rod shape determining protein RodA